MVDFDGEVGVGGVPLGGLEAGPERLAEGGGGRVDASGLRVEEAALGVVLALEEADGGLYAGIWEATLGKWRIEYEEWEFCHILSGVSIVTEDGGEAHTLKAGDSFILRPGFKGTWEVVETTRKEYVIRV